MRFVGVIRTLLTKTNGLERLLNYATSSVSSKCRRRWKRKLHRLLNGSNVGAKRGVKREMKVCLRLVFGRKVGHIQPESHLFL